MPRIGPLDKANFALCLGGPQVVFPATRRNQRFLGYIYPPIRFVTPATHALNWDTAAGRWVRLGRWSPTI